jgi:Domain of unknown function (DUF4396)
MALSHFVLFQPPLKVDTATHWFMMQVGMIVGYVTAWPVNRRLVQSGIKEKMDRRKHLAMMVERMRTEDADGDAADEATGRERQAARAGDGESANVTSRRA